jgi:hypothetical protein
VLSSLAVALVGCGKPFNVKTRPGLPPANYAGKAIAGSITVEAQAITDEDFLYETFDANLILARVLPVRVSVMNQGEETVDLKKSRFEILDQSGRRFQALSARDVFKRLLSYYGISTYSKHGYRESLNDFSGYALDVGSPLAGGTSRDGLLFFLMPDESAGRAGLTLVLSRLGKASVSAELRLN